MPKPTSAFALDSVKSDDSDDVESGQDAEAKTEQSEQSL